MKAFFHTIVARLLAFFRSRSLDSDFNQELEEHLAMSTADKIRRGMTPEEARRQARVELGGLTQLREAGRDVRGLPWLETFGLDVRLGLRMLRKSWGLTLIGGLAMAGAIGVGATGFAILDTFEGNTLPLDEGDRLVRLAIYRDRGTNVQDFEWWQKRLRSVEDIGAFWTVERSLVTGDRSDGRVSVAEMTASGFRLARVQPLAGRPLLEEDERDSSTPVVVIGYDVWQSRFSADRAVVGQTVQLDGVDHVVVGVMPKDFGFPVNHQAWIPFRASPLSNARRANADVMVFGRLAPRITIDSADAELAVIGRAPGNLPGDREPLIRARPYADSFVSVPWWFDIIPLLLALLVVPPCANIAILIYARNISRQEEFAARYVLGASRGRLVGQLLIEALVLAAAAGGVGVVLTYLFLERVQHFVLQDPALRLYVPFWMKPHISLETVLYIAGLAAFAAMVAGGVPALRATGRMRQSGFQALGSRTSPRLGITWTVLVATQVALSIAVLPAAAEASWYLLKLNILGPGYPSQEYVTAEIALDGGRSPARFHQLQAELVREARTAPGVSGATVSVFLHDEEGIGTIETDVDGQQLRVRPNHVDEAFFGLFGASLLAGRTFETADFSPGRPVVIVNRTFADELAAGNPSGRQVRYLSDQDNADSESAPWYEIVGVVDEISPNAPRVRIYHPLPSAMAAGEIDSARLTLRVGPAMPPGLAGRLMGIARALDPNLQMERFRTLDDVDQEDLRAFTIAGLGFATIALVVALFSAAGIHTLVTFAVTQRHREIGIRSALGAPPSRLVADIFRRHMSPVLGGVIVGTLLAWRINVSFANDDISLTVLFASAAFMIAIGLIAVAGPARRAIRINPTEALREG
jgi:putative ABC transport system permease protein